MINLYPLFTRNIHAHWQVLFDITKPELDILDRLEADEYERRVIEISLVVSIGTF